MTRLHPGLASDPVRILSDRCSIVSRPSAQNRRPCRSPPRPESADS